MVNSRKTRIWNCSYLCTAFVGQFDFGETDGFFGPMATVIWRVRMSINRILRSRFGFSTCNEKFVKILVYVFESLLPVCPFHEIQILLVKMFRVKSKQTFQIHRKFWHSRILTWKSSVWQIWRFIYLPAIHSPLIYLWRLCSIWRNSKWIV